MKYVLGVILLLAAGCKQKPEPTPARIPYPKSDPSVENSPVSKPLAPVVRYTGGSPVLFRLKLDLLPDMRYGFVLHGCVVGDDQHSTGTYKKEGDRITLLPDNGQVPGGMPTELLVRQLEGSEFLVPIAMQKTFETETAQHPGDVLKLEADKYAGGYYQKYWRRQPDSRVTKRGWYFALDDRFYVFAPDGSILSTFDLWPGTRLEDVKAMREGYETPPPFQVELNGDTLKLTSRLKRSYSFQATPKDK